MKHGKFTDMANESAWKKRRAMEKDNGLTGNAPVPHDLWRKVVPIAKEFERGNVAVAALYSYLLAHVNGNADNDRYMSAFTSVDRLAEDMCVGKNRVSLLSDILVAVGLLKTVYDYAGNRKEKLYYPQYYTTQTEDEMRRNIGDVYAERERRKAARKT
jgi:hypothetical protein